MNTNIVFGYLLAYSDKWAIYYLDFAKRLRVGQGVLGEQGEVGAPIFIRSRQEKNY